MNIKDVAMIPDNFLCNIGKESFPFGSAGFALPSHHHISTPKKSNANAHTTRCSKPLTIGFEACENILRRQLAIVIYFSRIKIVTSTYYLCDHIKKLCTLRQGEQRKIGKVVN